MMRFQPVKIAFCLAFLAFSGCSPKVNSLGHMRDGELKELIVVGKSTKDDVLSELGSPSSQSSFGSEVWYYISARQETVAFFKPEVVDQDVVRVEFNESGVVKDVTQFNKNDAKDFSVVKRTTPTEGHSMTIMEQFLGNIGRFNAPPGKTGGVGGPPGY